MGSAHAPVEKELNVMSGSVTLLLRLMVENIARGNQWRLSLATSKNVVVQVDGLNLNKIAIDILRLRKHIVWLRSIV